MAPPFRAEQIGSLLWPSELLSARTASGSISTYTKAYKEDIKQLTRKAISSAVEKQLSLLICPLTSGEFDRHILYGGFFEKLQGFEVIPEIPIPNGFRTKFPTITQMQGQGLTFRPGVFAAGKIRHVQSAYLEDWEFLRTLLPQDQWKDL
jgi:methionine synthase II (cobalamin-independent)